MITIKQFFANLIMEINETFEKIYQVAEENKIFESVYNKFGKLDSLEEKLSPKLKALLAAGLIGTASLGMQSCAQPTDDYTNPAPTEEVKPKDNETPPPAPADNPTDNTTTNPTRETPKEDDGGKNTVEETVWQKLGITDEQAALLKKANKAMTYNNFTGWAKNHGEINYIYQDGSEGTKGKFVQVTDFDSDEYKNIGDGKLVSMIDNGKIYDFFIPIKSSAYTLLGNELGYSLN